MASTDTHLNGAPRRVVAVGASAGGVEALIKLAAGHAEMLLSHSDRFTPLNLKQRVFRKAVGTHNGIDRYAIRSSDSVSGALLLMEVQP